MSDAKNELALRQAVNLPAIAEQRGIDPQQMTAAELQEILPDAMRTLADRTDAEAVRISKKPDGIEVRLVEKPLFISLEDLSERLPSRPSVRVLQKTCRELGVRIGRIGQKPCVSIEAFNKALGGGR